MSRTLSPQLWTAIEDSTPLGITRAGGLTANIPALTAKGFAPGCLFHIWDATTAEGGLYINIGTKASANFVPLSQSGSALGFIDLPLASWRAIASNDIAGMTGTPVSGILAVDTAPKLIRVSTSTDKALTISWAASSSIEIAQSFSYPPDLDATKSVVVHVVIKSGGATNTGAVTVGYFEGIGDTTRGGDTGATSAAYQDLTVTVTPTAGHPMFAAVALTPAAHTTDTMVIKQTYVTYTRKSVTT